MTIFAYIPHRVHGTFDWNSHRSISSVHKIGIFRVQVQTLKYSGILILEFVIYSIIECRLEVEKCWLKLELYAEELLWWKKLNGDDVNLYRAFFVIRFAIVSFITH